MDNINIRSSKEELISGALEYIDIQEQQIIELRQRQAILFCIIAVFLIKGLL